MSTYVDTYTDGDGDPVVAVGDRVMVTFAGTVQRIRVDDDGPALLIRNEDGYGIHWIKTAAGNRWAVSNISHPLKGKT